MPILNENATEFAESLEIFLDKEPECQSPTRHNPAKVYYVPCSHDVTHLIKTCTDGGLICQNAADSIKAEAPVALCCYCGRSTAECWTLIPV